MIENRWWKKNRLFSNRSIENDRSQIFDRNHYSSSTVSRFWLLWGSGPGPFFNLAVSCCTSYWQSARDHLASHTLVRAPGGVISILEEMVHRIFELDAAASTMADCSEEPEDRWRCCQAGATPPSAWRLGRIVGICPGADGLVRVSQVRVANGAIFECSVRSLVPLLVREWWPLPQPVYVTNNRGP